MANLNVSTTVTGPDNIEIALVRADYLETSNTFRICFEICLAIGGTVLGCIISLVNDGKHVPILDWIFLGLMAAGCIAFLILASKNYTKAKSQVSVT